MKKAFTLIELMITIAVMAILMALVFRLNSVGTDSHKRTVTIMRLQKLENCLSGYHAAFGCYPQVELHGTRNIYAEVDDNGIQYEDGGENRNLWNWNEIGEQNEQRAWHQVQAACKAQPVDCRFPFPEGYEELVRMVSDEMKRRAQSNEKRYKAYYESEQRRTCLTMGYDDGICNLGRFNDKKDKTDWREIQLFKFGLMSFLLPRYLVMMNGPPSLFDYAQWVGNNLTPCDPFTGKSFESLGGWKEIRNRSLPENENTRLAASIESISSQAVCRRWMPNLQNICSVNRPDSMNLYGINIKADGTELDVDNPNIEIYSPNHSGANQYVLDGVTVRDGWNNEFYYYSPSPHQRYILWSAGPNGRTFPPWIDRDSIEGSKAKECIGKWVADDIIHLSN